MGSRKRSSDRTTGILPVQASSGSHLVFPVGEDGREEWIVAFEEFVGEPGQAWIGEAPVADAKEMGEQVIGRGIGVGSRKDGQGAGRGAGDAHPAVDEEVGGVPVAGEGFAGEGEDLPHVIDPGLGQSCDGAGDVVEVECQDRACGRARREWLGEVIASLVWAVAASWRGDLLRSEWASGEDGFPAPEV
jgi:hypothetical protein